MFKYNQGTLTTDIYSKLRVIEKSNSTSEIISHEIQDTSSTPSRDGILFINIT